MRTLHCLQPPLTHTGCCDMLSFPVTPSTAKGVTRTPGFLCALVDWYVCDIKVILIWYTGNTAWYSGARVVKYVVNLCGLLVLWILSQSVSRSYQTNCKACFQQSSSRRKLSPSLLFEGRDANTKSYLYPNPTLYTLFLDFRFANVRVS